MSTTTRQERRANEALQAAQRATERDKTAKLQEPQKRCASCGAPVHHEPKEGEGLPCGH